MRAIIAFFAFWALMITPTMAQKTDLAEAKRFVTALADDAITILSTEKLSLIHISEPTRPY